MTRLEDLRGLVDGAAAEDLPDIIGALEGAKARAFARLTTTTAAPARRAGPGADRLLSMREVATRLGWSEYTAREHGRKGELKALVVEIGRRRGIRESSLERFLELRENGKA